MVDCVNEQQGEFVYLTDFAVNEEDGWSVVVVNEAAKCVVVNDDDPRIAEVQEDTWSVVVNEENGWCQIGLLQEPPESAPTTPSASESQAITLVGHVVPKEDLLFCEEYFQDIPQPPTPEKIRVSEQNTEESDFVDLKICAEGNTEALQEAEIFSSDDRDNSAQYDTPLIDDSRSGQVDEAIILGMQRCSKYFLLDDNVLHQQRKIDLLGNRERGKAAKKALKFRNRYLY